MAMFTLRIQKSEGVIMVGVKYLVALGAIFITLQPALSQSTYDKNGKLIDQSQHKPYNTKPAWQTTGESLAKPPENLKEKVNLDGIPDYTGKQRFLNGLVYDHVVKQGPNYVMTFNVKESPEQVKEWYQNVFQMYKWNITHNDPTSLMATDKDFNTCIVQIAGPVTGYAAKDEHGSYTIRYQYAKPR